MGSERLHGERGASLVLALLFLMMFAALIPALLDLGSTNFLATQRLHEGRNAVYAADGTTDAALQYLRSHPGCGRKFQSNCPIGPAGQSTSTFQATINMLPATTTITATGGTFELDRTVTLSTAVDGNVLVQAVAIIRDSSTAAEPPVDVKSWNVG